MQGTSYAFNYASALIAHCDELLVKIHRKFHVSSRSASRSSENQIRICWQNSLCFKGPQKRSCGKGRMSEKLFRVFLPSSSLVLTRWSLDDPGFSTPDRVVFGESRWVCWYNFQWNRFYFGSKGKKSLFKTVRSNLCIRKWGKFHE